MIAPTATPREILITRSRLVSHNDSDGRKNDLEHKQVYVSMLTFPCDSVSIIWLEAKHATMNTGPNVMEDPLDRGFGSITGREEICNPGSSITPTRHDHKRSHRRRRMHHHELRSEHHA
ncbi:hypothetical protein HS088_TW01G00172 [Tripterygium wilfordii]|uniref:Uncharacterized protein n=1 Tax=Tripterygium wilfordii TaxID=458696 RepID=A0A7J7E1E3_TRIWF|nr:hypothetical protein HS088_TW01G00172 [Tripterygium wilfordii]